MKVVEAILASISIPYFLP